MSQSLALVLVHIIFSTKNREPFLNSPQLRSNMHAYLTGTLRQSGYGAFSVSQSSTARVIAYIANQEIHYRKVTFQDEFRSFLRKHGLGFDERYVWD